MKIFYFGHSCFQIISKPNQEEITILIDPFSEEIGLKLPKLKADILLLTHSHFDHSNTKAVSGDYFLISGPGEYEIKNVFIKGISAFHDNKEGKERGEITIYKIMTEGFKICHLGDFGQKELTPEQIEQIGEVDILMIPVGGIYTIDGKEASKIVSQIEPKIVIPMHFKESRLKIKLNPLDDFLKFFSKKFIEETQNKITLKEKDLPKEGTKILVLRL